MYPTGDELRQALSRQEPAADFTARVMQQVRAERRVRRFPLKRWSIVGAIAASLTVGIYVRQQRRAERHVLAVQEAELAGEQLLESLQLAGWQIHKAREAVLQPVVEDSQ
jgi:hypothetical protein